MMRWIVLLLSAMLLAPSGSAYILVYSKGFNYKGNYGRDVFVNVDSVGTIIETWRSWGFENIQIGQTIDPNADGIIVLGCTQLDENDVEALDEYIRNGGRVAIDLFCPGKIDDLAARYGVIRNPEKAYKGGDILSEMKLPYIHVRGYPIDRPIVMKNTPTSSKYVGMVYIGPTFTITSDYISSAFITPVGEQIAFYGKAGKGEIYGSGCLLCSNQLLMANILDWVEDGDIDFPQIEIDRRVYPPVKEVGKPFYDEIWVYVPPEEKASLYITVSYIYNEQGFCKLTPTQQTETKENAFVIRYEYEPDREMTCTLAPVIVSATWTSPKGVFLREFTVNGGYVQVLARTPYLPKEYWPYIFLGILTLAGVFALAYILTKQRREIKRLKKRLKALNETIEDLHKKYMTRQITEDVYKRLLEQYIAEIEHIKARIKELEDAKK